MTKLPYSKYAMTFNNPPTQENPVCVIDEKNWFGNKTFACRGSIYQVEDIIEIQSNNETTTINHLTTHQSVFTLTLLNGIVVAYQGSSMVIETKQIRVLRAASDFIKRITFAQRIYQYSHQIKIQGYFEYSDHFIYDNGDIKTKGKVFNIAQAGLQNNLEFSLDAPLIFLYAYKLNVYQHNQGAIFRKKLMSIKINKNRDVIYAILMALSKIKTTNAHLLSVYSITNPIGNSYKPLF